MEEPKVEIGLREIYDKLLETHSAVTNVVPRLEKVEQKADTAYLLAQDADLRSRENHKHQVWFFRALATIASGGTVTVIGAWAANHMH